MGINKGPFFNLWQSFLPQVKIVANSAKNSPYETVTNILKSP